jgi:ubiquinone/menaquinone biosynthesis C-methylase UbiE
LGCGDGRDGFYFSKKKIKKVLCIDSSPIVIKNNNIYKNKKKIKNISFICLKAQSSKLLTLGNFDIIYSRFFLHTINKVAQDKIFKHLIKIYAIVNM